VYPPQRFTVILELKRKSFFEMKTPKPLMQHLVMLWAKTGAISAFRDSVVTHLAEREDQELFLRRLGLIFSVPAIWSAVAHEDRISRMELADGIARSQRRKKTSLADQLVAACCLAALDIALEAWVDADGKVSLEALIDQSIAELSKIS